MCEELWQKEEENEHSVDTDKELKTYRKNESYETTTQTGKTLRKGFRTVIESAIEQLWAALENAQEILEELLCRRGKQCWAKRSF